MSNKILKAALAVSFVVIIGLSFWGFKSDQKNFEISKNLDIFYSLVRELNLFYVDEVKPDKLIKKGIDDMLETLDPYTVYIPESEMDDFKFMTTGEYAGIGAMISKRGNQIIVAEPYEGFPAQVSGLRAGDIFIEVDGKPVDKMVVSDVSEILKGPAKKVIKVKMQRPGEKKPFTLDIVREDIQIDPVTYYGMIDAKTGYVRLSSFTDGCAESVRDAIVDLRDKKGAKSLVLDLRSNPGGLLGEAVKITNLFVNHGQEIVSTKGKVSQWDKTYRATEQPVDSVMPLIVLVNSGSASASEIVAGALQDLDRAVIMGNRTFGKGLVQTTRDLSYNTKLKVTTAKYYIPSGRCIQALDYTHRNADGSVGNIPDSLITVFKTKNGRLVKDGGGINPDIRNVQDTLSALSFKLVQDYMIFDFATEYASKHKTIAPPDKFDIDDDIYKEFHKYLTEKKFTYESRSEQTLKVLIETARKERYFDGTKNEFTALEKGLTLDLNQDLDKNSEEIRDLLKDEIVSRYYYQKGAIIAALGSDKEIKSVLSLFNNPAEYSRLLIPGASATALK
ncbi:MAG TPA: S41 family peptidase [Prolixibacteraceae bacterium]|nr:S41 family peptidase [Prolixibacteraceae bacterium]